MLLFYKKEEKILLFKKEKVLIREVFSFFAKRII
jgi:hypothetical protein